MSQVLAKQQALSEKIWSEMANLKKAVESKDGWKDVKSGKFWTCQACGDERCFTSRSTCHNCGVPRPNQPQAAAAKAKTVKENSKAEVDAMDLTEPEEPTKSLEDQIGELEALLKSVKAVKDSDRSKALLEGWEMDLKDLRE